MLPLAGCSVVAPPDVDPRPVEAAIRADPHVASLRTTYTPATVEHRALLDLQVDLRARVDADGLVGTVARAAGLLRADGFDEIEWNLTFRSADQLEVGSLRLEATGSSSAQTPAVESVESETRRWTEIAAEYPGAGVQVSFAGDRPALRKTWLRVADHGSVATAYDAVAAIPALPVPRASVGVGVMPPDPGRSVSYSTDGAPPPKEAIDTMQTLAAVASPVPAGLGIKLEATWFARPPPAPYLDVIVRLLPEEYYRVPGTQINALVPGTRTDRIAREYERVLDGSGLRFRLLVKVYDNRAYIARDTR